MPDLDLLAGEYAGGEARYYLDLVVSGGENQSPAVCFGLGRSRPSGHVYFREDFKRGIAIKAGDRLSLARTIHEALAKCTLSADLSSAAVRAPRAGAPIT